MAEQITEHRTVKLENVRQNNIVYVDLSKKLEETVFHREYTKAAWVIKQILDENDDNDRSDEYYCRECKSRNCRSCKHRDYTACRNGANGKHPTEYQTAVPFIGERGTGKSSIMYSVLKRLQTYNGETSDAVFNLGLKYNTTKFITFDVIDANTLKETEDVMEILLARMLSYLETFEPACDFRELYRQIDELHEALCMMRGKWQEGPDTYGLMGLQKVADSQKTIESFRELVADFRRTMSTYKYNCQQCYLVIALDDIDMYQGSNCGMQNSQFALLEHIYNHMRIPGLIVLLTYNENILKRSCNRHFEQIYFGTELTRNCSPTERRDIDTLTGQFMSKLFPQEKRIYLPNFMFIDSANQSNLYVSPVLNVNGAQNIIAPFNETKDISVKEFMLRLIAHKTGVCFDAAGTKVHFFEPRNLRNLGELFEVIYSMEEITGDETAQEEIRSRNRQELLKYMYNQFALRHLDTDEYERFRRLSVLPLGRQHKTMVDWIRDQRMAVKEGNLGSLSKLEKDRWKYSYGELLHNIYFSTRIPKMEKKDETAFSKAFMHSIFGTHSVLLNNIVYMPGSRKNLLELIGFSVAGRWANEMLPSFFHEDYTGTQNAGSIRLPLKDYFGWKIPYELQQEIIKLGTTQGSSQKHLLFDFLEALVIAGMFFTGCSADGFGLSLVADLDETGTPVLCLKSNSVDPICFNVLNFVINGYNAIPESEGLRLNFYDGLKVNKKLIVIDGSFLPCIHSQLMKLGEDLAMNLSKDWEKNRRKAKQLDEILKQQMDSDSLVSPDMQQTGVRRSIAIKEIAVQAKIWEQLIQKELTEEKGHGTFDTNRFIKKWNSILNKVIKEFAMHIEEWERVHKNHLLALPIQNFDMMYNIVKRLASTSYHDIPVEAPVSQVFNYYVRLYERVAEELKYQDQIYYRDGEDGFANAFQSTIFYQLVTATSGQKMYNPYVQYVLVSMIRATAGAQRARERITTIGRPEPLNFFEL